MKSATCAALLALGLGVAACGDSGPANENAAGENEAQAGNGTSAGDGDAADPVDGQTNRPSPVPDPNLPQPVTPPPSPTPIPPAPQANEQEPPPALEQDYLNRNKQSSTPPG
jgi:hypothetical protein